MRIRRGIRTKIVWLNVFLVFIMMLCMGILNYITSKRLLYCTIGDNYRKTAESLSYAVSSIIDEELHDIKGLLSLFLDMSQIENANLRYKEMDRDSIKKWLSGMDKEWINASTESSILKEYLDNKFAVSLNRIAKEDKDISEIFVTDIEGGLIAASNKTTDFYQADEEWWQYGFNNGEGRIFIGDVEFDDSSKTWAIPFAVPIMNNENRVIGICKAVTDINSFFKPLEDTRLGSTGHACMINEEGYIIFHPGITPLSIKLCNGECLKKILNKETGWLLLDNPHNLKGRYLASFNRIRHASLLERGKNWAIVIDQEVSEILGPFERLISYSILIFVTLIIIIIPFVYIASYRFVKPIKELHRCTELFAAGDLLCKPKIKTGDEIEQLADAFISMAKKIKENRDNLKTWADTLETKVKERTVLLEGARKDLEVKVGELSDSRDAVINIMEDIDIERKNLEKTYNDLKDTQGALVRSERLAVLGQLATSVSHELRNPLGVMRNAVYYLNMQKLGEKDKKVQEYLDILNKEIAISDRIISDILEFSKVRKPVPSDKYINDVINDVLSEIKIKHDIKLLLNLGSNLPVISIDELQIRRVFSNLISNALDAMDKGGILRISTFVEGDFLITEFCDTGMGIASENINKIFQPLFSTKPKGIGLGLAICRSIIEAHGGNMSVKSDINKGSVFMVKLPV